MLALRFFEIEDPSFFISQILLSFLGHRDPRFGLRALRGRSTRASESGRHRRGEGHFGRRGHQVG